MYNIFQQKIIQQGKLIIFQYLENIFVCLFGVKLLEKYCRNHYYHVPNPSCTVTKFKNSKTKMRPSNVCLESEF